MSNKLDRSLQEIIESQPRRKSGATGGGSKGRSAVGARKSSGGGGISKRSTAPLANRTRPAAKSSSKLPAGASFDGTSKVIISNLPTDINEQQIREYFGRVVVPTKSVAINYNRSGHSTGVATIVFKSTSGAEKAFKEFNGRSIDKTKRLKVEIVAAERNPLDTIISTPAAASSSSRAASSRTAPRPARSTSKKAISAPRRDAPRRVAVGGTRKPIKQRNVRERRPNKTAEQLDAEMEDYFADK